MKTKSNSQLLNWNPSKGNPFDYTISEFHDTISEDTKWEIAEPEKFKSVHTIFTAIHLKTLASMNLKYTSLLCGLDKRTNKLVYHLDKYIDCKKPIVVWLDYPFKKIVKATIYPLVRIFNENKKNSMILDDMGYLIWQIARVYADIYKNHWGKVGIWGHGFEDLYLEGIGICKNNEIKLYIGS